MKLRFTPTVCLLLLLVMQALDVVAQINITTNGVSALQLANTITGDKLQVSNVTISAGGGSCGLFSKGQQAGIGLESGIVMSTGRASSIKRPASWEMSDALGINKTDPDLVKINPSAVNDVCILEFDIIPFCDSIQISYVFASEEYPGYVCSDYNDIFGFFITGEDPNGGQYNAKNIAVVPGTQTPVGINTINSGYATDPSQAHVCDAIDPNWRNYKIHFRNQENNNQQVFNGSTVPLVAKAAVVPCKKYRLKLAIADSGDDILDSGVFLEAEGLSCESSPLILSVREDSLKEVCGIQTLEVDRIEAGSDLEINVHATGSASIGEDYALSSSYTIPAGQTHWELTVDILEDLLVEGTEKVELTVSYALCNGEVEFSNPVEFYILDGPALKVDAQSETCKGKNDAYITLSELQFHEPLTVTVIHEGTEVFKQEDITTIDEKLTAPDFGKYEVQVVDKDGCTKTYEVTIEKGEELNPIQDVKLLHNMCFGDCKGEISFLAVGAESYSLNEEESQNQGLFDGVCAGTYTLKARKGNCVQDTTVTILQPDPILIETSSIDKQCKGSQVQLSASVSGGQGNTTIQWVHGGETTTGNTLSLTVEETTLVKVFGADSLCRSEEKQVLIEVYPDLTAYVTASAFDLCAGDTVNIEGITAGGKPQVVAFWKDQQGNVVQGSVLELPVTQSGEVQFIAADACGNSVDQTVQLNVHAAPQIQLSTDVVAGCAPLEVNFDSGVQDIGSIQWSFGDGDSSTHKSPEHVYTESGKYDVWIKAVSVYGCAAEKSYTDYIEVYPDPQSIFKVTPTELDIYHTDIAVENYAVDAVKQEWFIDGEFETREEEFEYTFPQGVEASYEICLYVESERGCVDTSCQEVQVKEVPVIFVPNAFTPDGDGTNDYFWPVVTGYEAKSFVFAVYDRWGQQVYQSVSTEERWDGTHKGKRLPHGVYVWMLEIKSETIGQSVTKRGHVTLIR